MRDRWDERYLAVFDSYGFDDKAINDDFGGDFDKLDDLFYDVASQIINDPDSLGKLPSEFRVDFSLYMSGDPAIIKRFEEPKMKLMCLSDLYDYLRIYKYS